uniref:Glycosyl hydrolase-like 10 domain-containing protein n=1 Tax=Neobodo designis TaxID=312471 RepID=A0A7S1MJS9_NEODS|mmetsp:Transcript_4193/g.13370  ORF Transcript_4193/g.13370 Transcript_4193/m.13370 type:complete len:277 (+) Transcript_4193:140-970(+)
MLPRTKSRARSHARRGCPRRASGASPRPTCSSSPPSPDAVSPVDHFTMIRGWGLMYGVEIVAWFEYGLMACYGEPGFRPFPSYAESQGWLMSGSAEGGFRYMDPSNAGVQAFLANMMAEVGAAGAQLDDHFSCPTAYSGCSEAKMTAAARAIAQQVGGRTQLHLAPAPLSFSIDHLNANWLPWLQQGLFSTVAPQLYTANPTQYETELSESLAAVGAGFKSKYLAGVRVLGAGSDTPWTDVDQMLSIAQRSGVGVSIWDVAGITELYKTQFQQLWG